MIIENLKIVDSTQEYIKKYVKKRRDAVVYATEQTAGKGTKGRTFISAKGGLYVSKLTFHTNLKAQNGWSVMVETAMAVVKTLLAFNLQPKIKWPNDIWVNNKKICGILTQNSFSGEIVDYSLVGIGINVNNEIADEIKDIAISMKDALGEEVDIERVFSTLLLNLSTPSTMEEYKYFSAILGKEITVIKGDEKYGAKAVDINEKGGLVLDSGEILYAGEIGLKIAL